MRRTRDGLGRALVLGFGCWLLGGWFSQAGGDEWEYTVLKYFDGSVGGVNNPRGVMLVGDYLYGVSQQGSTHGNLYRINTDGTGYTNLISFTTQGDYFPYSLPCLVGDCFYGTLGSAAGGILGVVYRVNLDGSDYTNLHDFPGDSSEGSSPCGTPVVSEGVIYGTTRYGGPTGKNVGTIWKVETNGNNFAVLRVGTNTVGNFGRPVYDALLLSGGALYGTGTYGGNGMGTVWRINTDGSSFTNLHECPSAGANRIYGAVIQSGSTLYGMCTDHPDWMGTYEGNIFKVNTDGTGYTELHAFPTDGSQGKNPQGTLTLVDDTLYGMTEFGGSTNLGVIFSIDTNGNNYTILHHFTGGVNSDGARPQNGPLAVSPDGNTFYGTTLDGGADAGNDGVLFRLRRILAPEATVILIQ